MKVKLHFRVDDTLSYEFEVEGSDWLTVLREEKALAEEYDKALDIVFPRKSLLERLLSFRAKTEAEK